jgi:hypothetical protein
MAKVFLDGIEFQFDQNTWTICNNDNEILDNVIEDTVEILCSKIFFEKKNSNKLKLPRYSKIKKNETFTCSICLEESVPGTYKRQLPCSHVFHKKCVDKWIAKDNTCPICRTEILAAVTESPDRCYNLTPDYLKQ